MACVLPASAYQLTFIDLILKTALDATADPQLRVLRDGPQRLIGAAGHLLGGKLHTKHGVIS